MKRFLVATLVVLGMTFVSGPVQANLNDGLIAYYPFNGSANDESGNGNHGTVNGATLTSDRFGNSNSAYSFDGLDDYIIISDGSQFNFSNELSLSLWVNPHANQIHCAALIDKSHAHVSNGGKAKGWVVQDCQHGTNNHIFQHCSKNQCVNGKNVYFALQNDIWTHILVVKQSIKLTYYINGSYYSTYDEIYSEIDTNGSLPLIIGNVNNLRRFFKGKIDDVHIYNRALSASEVQQLYTGGDTSCGDYDAGYLAGMAFCKSNPSACGIAPCPSSGSALINADLSFSIPNAVYQSPFGNMELDLNFDFFGEQSGRLLWELESLTVK